MLPVPTVSSIDTTEAALSDIERRRAMKAPNIAGAVTDAVNTGLTVNKAVQEQADADVARSAADTARAQAQWFQKNYVDQGWEGYQKAWQDAGSPAEADPRFVRKAVGDTPDGAFALLHTVIDKKSAETATTAYEDALKDPSKTPAELSALAIAAGKAVGPKEGLETINKERDRAIKQEVSADAITSREKIAAARNATAKMVAGIRRDAANLKGDDKAQVDFFLESAKNADAEIASVYGKYGTDESTRSYSLTPEDKKKIDGIARQRDDALRNANILIRKGAKPGTTATDGGLDVPTTTVWRLGPDGKTQYEYDAATKKPTGKSK